MFRIVAVLLIPMSIVRCQIIVIYSSINTTAVLFVHHNRCEFCVSRKTTVCSIKQIFVRHHGTYRAPFFSLVQAEVFVFSKIRVSRIQNYGFL